MFQGLQAMGVGVEEQGDQWRISPDTLRGPATVNVGNAGTVMRFLPPVATLATGKIHFDGDPRSYERPLGPVITALQTLGAQIEDDGRKSLPLTVVGSGELKGGSVDIDASASSQFVSALLLIGARTTNGARVRHIGGLLPSLPHIEMTIHMLADAGVTVERVGSAEWFVAPQRVQPQNLVIEPDLSNAAPFLAAAMVCGGETTIEDWPHTTTQPGDQLRDILACMGGRFDFVENGLKVTGNTISGIDRDLHDVGELTPVIAALCALADSPSHLHGIAHLRLHETDRLAALAREINSLGGDVTETDDGLKIVPKPLHGGIFHTYEDHRLATAGAVLGLRIEGIEVENIATTSKTMPGFPELWNELLRDESLPS